MACMVGRGEDTEKTPARRLKGREDDNGFY